MGLKVRSQTKRQVEMRAGNNRRRHLRLETLESRHLLSVSVPIDAAHDFTDEQATEVGPSLQNVAVPQSIVAPLSTSAGSFSTIGYGYNGRLQEWLPEFSGGSVNLGGVPFSIPATGDNVWHSADPWTAGPNPRTLTIPVNLFGAQRVYTLINAWWGETAPGTYASITFVGSAGATYVFDLDGDSDVRDYFHGNHANAINGTTTTNVFSAGAKRIDMQSITLPEAFHTQTLTSIQVTDNGINWFGVNDPIQQRIYLAGLTVESVPSGVDENWSHIVSGNGQPVFNGRVFSTTNGNTWAVNSYPPTPDFNVSLTPGGIRMQAPPSPTPFLAREYILSNSNQAFQNLVAHTTVTLTSPPVAESQGGGLLARGNVSLGNGYALLIVPGSAELVRIDGFVARSLQSFSIPQLVSGRTYGMRLVANGPDLIGIIYDGSLTGPTIGVLRASDSTYATAGATGLVGASIAQAPSIDATFGAFVANPLGAVPPTVGGLTATPTGTTSVGLRWNRTITTNDPYYLERATAPDGPFTQIAILDATKTSYVDKGSHLSPSTPYYYRLWALSNNVPSPYSAVADVETLGDPIQLDSGPRIISPAAGSFGTLTAPVSHLDVTFSEAIDPASFIAADVILQHGPTRIPVQQPFRPDAVNQPLTWRIPFAAQSIPGIYTVQIGPDIADSAGNPMDQNANGKVDGTADQFIGSFALDAVLTPSATRITGIDRWWAYSGKQFAVNLGIDIAVDGEYFLNIGVVDGSNASSSWHLSSGAYVTINGSPTQHLFSPIGGGVQLGHLSSGSHLIHIHDFVSPNRFVIQNIGFLLSGPPSQDDRFVASFVSDRPGLNSATVTGLGFEDGFGNPISVSSIDDLVTLFAPTLYFGASEHYAQPFPVQATISAFEFKDGTGRPLYEDISLVGDVDAYLDLPAASHFPVGEPTVYAAVVPDFENDRLAINYWFHYPYNDWKDQLQHRDPPVPRGWGNNHEGDWEGITVFFERSPSNNSFQPKRVAFAQHVRVDHLFITNRAGQLFDWNATVSPGRTSPHVYVAVGSHASYGRAGESPAGGTVTLPLRPPLFVQTGVDEHWGDGPSLAPNDFQVVNLMRAPETAGTSEAWSLYPGLWGEPNLDGGMLVVQKYVPLGGNAGPRGPIFQAGGFESGTRWLDPWTWAEGFESAGDSELVAELPSYYTDTMPAVDGMVSMHTVDRGTSVAVPPQQVWILIGQSPLTTTPSPSESRLPQQSDVKKSADRPEMAMTDLAVAAAPSAPRNNGRATTRSAAARILDSKLVEDVLTQLDSINLPNDYWD